jgi:hypothetical protein
MAPRKLIAHIMTGTHMSYNRVEETQAIETNVFAFKAVASQLAPRKDRETRDRLVDRAFTSTCSTSGKEPIRKRIITTDRRTSHWHNENEIA